MSGRGGPDRTERLWTARAPSRGLPREPWRDGYHILLTMPLMTFFGLTAAGFVAFNCAFAGLYLLDPHGISGARPGSFADAFFFSVQTVGTLGYGVMAPHSFYANVLVTLEIFVGLFSFAAAASLLFARISRPTAMIMFSQRAVITPYEGVPTLMFRAANRRRNLVVEAEVSVTLVHDVKSREGATLRRFDELKVVRARTPLFFLTWQVMHPIDEASPLFGETAESLLTRHIEILVVMKGLDETFVSTIHARTSYRPQEIVWNARLADIFDVDDQGQRVIDFRRFHDVVTP